MSAHAETRNGPPATHPHRWGALAIVLVAEVMDLLDSLATSVAGPTIERELGGGQALVQWVTAAYTIAMASGLLVGGRLGDRFGRSRVFQVGMAGFLAGSLACSLAPDWRLLLAARVVQGAFGALMLPQGLGMIKQMLSPQEAGRAFGAFGPVMGLSTVCGPILAGWLVDANLWGSSWRAIFLLNLPLAIVALVAGLRLLPANHPDPAQRVDVPSSLLASAAMALVVFPLIQGRELGWRWWVWAVLGLGIAALVGFGLLEQGRGRRGLTTLVSPQLLRHRSFLAGLGVGTAFFAALSATTFVYMVFVQLGLGWSTLRASLMALPQALGSVAGFGVAAAVGGGLGNRRTMQLGQATGAAGLVALAATVHWCDVGRHGWWMAPALAILGTGMGMAMAPFFDSALAGVDQANAGSASGVLNAVQQLGGALGIAGLGTLFFHLADGGAARPAAAWCSLAGAGLLVVAVLLCGSLPSGALPVADDRHGGGHAGQ